MKFILVVALILSFTLSCNDDNNAPFAERVPPDDLSEIFIEDDAEIVEFLETHFYNYEDFQAPAETFNYQVVIDTIADDNSDKIPLIEQMKTKMILVESDRFNAPEEENVQHKLYYLEVREGQGEQPSIADSTYVRYNGSLLNGSVFDGSTEVPVWFDLASIQGAGARGFAEGTALFKAGDTIIENTDGTFSVGSYGIGLMVFPSGLGYYNSLQSTIPAYSPLIFQVDLFTIAVTDHDQDGKTSIEEDTNGDGYLFNDDADGDGIPDYLDSDS